MLRLAARLVLVLILTLIGSACAVPAPVNDAERALIEELSRVCEQELQLKGIPALSISLVDGDRVVWSAGFGERVPGERADADTAFRIGSVSKLFTDLAMMQLVERGVLNLDTPVAHALPGFLPENPYATSITLRQLTAHRAGLVREPPVGHYFDDTGASLAATTRSMNETRLVCEPGTRTKYSNAGIAVVGSVLEAHYGKPYSVLMHEQVLLPMGLGAAAMEATPAIQRRLAAARMWAYDGSEAPAPTFELGMAPAGNLYASVNELAQFLRVIFAAGHGPRGELLRPETLALMMTPTPGPDGKPTRYGIGFAIDELDGHRRCGHGGAVYGFSTALSFLPEERLGVAVAASMDVSNALTDRIAQHALRGLLAVRDNEALPHWPVSEPVPPQRARTLAGRWSSSDGEVVEIVHHDTRVTMERRGMIAELRSLDGVLTVDDRHVFGAVVEQAGPNGIEIGGVSFARLPRPQPEPCPERWSDLIGEYGWDHNVLFVRERDGELEALIEWFWFDALTEIAPDVFELPRNRGLYPLEQLRFRRDATGRVTTAVLGAVEFRRRPSAAEGEVFRITPVLPVAELRRRAEAASPPIENGVQRVPDLVDLARAVPGIALDVRYASTDNFMSTVFYPEARAFLQRPAAEALARVRTELAAQGYGLLIHDAYRPWHVTKMFWDATPTEFKHFVADPSEGSRHNRGCAVDLTLTDLATGEPVTMTGGYDEFSTRSYPEYPGGTSLQRWRRELLRITMERHGFSVYEWEWWHFDFENWQDWPILDRSFAELDAAAVESR